MTIFPSFPSKSPLNRATLPTDGGRQSTPLPAWLPPNAPAAPPGVFTERFGLEGPSGDGLVPCECTNTLTQEKPLSFPPALEGERVPRGSPRVQGSEPPPQRR